MEASLISFLLDKLSGIQVDQAQRTPPLDQIHARLYRITAGFRITKVFLESSIWSTTAVANEQLEAWIEQVRAVVLKVEDIIDGYLYLVGEQRERTWKDYLSRSSNLCCDLSKTWHGIDSRLEATEKKIFDLLDVTVIFGLRSSSNEDRIDSKQDRNHYQVHSPMLIDEDDLVGMEENKKILLRWLTDADTCRQMRTIAVWGKGGQGKTTLVANIYCNDTVKSHFDCQVWVTISQNYSVEEILRRIILEIFKRKSILNDITFMPLAELLFIIQKSLDQKRYIVVLDDVWNEKLWEKIQNAFLNSNNGSRLIITTRKHKVAKIASQQHIVELQQLDEEAKRTSQQHIVELQQLNEEAKRESQQHIVELQKLNEVANITSQLQQFYKVAKIASQLQLNIASQLQQLDEATKIASQQHIINLQRLTETAKRASQQHIQKLQQLNKEVGERASKQFIEELQQLNEVGKRASQQHIELQLLNEVSKIASQLQQVANIASELQQLNEAAKRASQQHIEELQQLNEVASQQHIEELQQLNEVAKRASQQHIVELLLNEVSKIESQLQQLNEVAKRASQQHIVEMLQLNEVAKRASQQHILELLQLNEVVKIASQLQQLNEKAKRASQHHIIELQKLNEIAKVEHTIELQLNEKDAWDLFCKKAFRRENNIDCPQKLEDYVPSILKKCHGSPLAVAVIGGLLSTKEKSKTDWKKVHNRFHWEFGKNSLLNEVSSIINFCFNDLPYYLKNCFVYFSIFPQDYLIKRKKLVRLWVAEGFVEARSSDRVMEEEADNYLAELVDRSMLQVVKRNEFGRPKAFRMHDVVREVTLEISRKANFCMILKGSQSVLDNPTRRLSIQTSDESSLHLNKSLSQLRSLVMFSTYHFSPHSLRAVLTSLKMLRVLELEDTSIYNLPTEVSALFSLHYLGLRWTKVKQLPNDIQKLQSLQTLDLRDSRIKKLPHGVTQLKQLRNLFVPEIEVEFGGTVVGYAPTLKVACQWKNLQTLRSIKATMKLAQLLGDMKELRSLEIVEVQQAHCPQLCSSLTKMRNLRCLRLFARGEEQLDFEMLNSSPPPLQKLDISGRLFGGKMPTFIYSCTELIRVKLLWSQLIEDPLPALGQLDKLMVLILGPRAYEGQKLHFRTGWFRNLKRLYLGGLVNLNNIEVEEVPIASLHELVMAGLPELKMIPRGMQFLNHRQCLSV